MPRDVVLHGALLEGTGTQMDKPLEGIRQRRSPSISYDRNLQHHAWAASEVLTGAAPAQL